MITEIPFSGGKFTKFKNKDFSTWNSVNPFPIQGIPYISIIYLSDELKNSLELEFEENFEDLLVCIYDYSEGDFTLSFYTTISESKMTVCTYVVFNTFQDGVDWIRTKVKNPQRIFCSIKNWDIL